MPKNISIKDDTSELETDKNAPRSKKPAKNSPEPIINGSTAGYFGRKYAERNVPISIPRTPDTSKIAPK